MDLIKIKQLVETIEKETGKRILFKEKNTLKEKINKINSISKQIEKITGKKVIFKEDIEVKTKKQKIDLKKTISHLQNAYSSLDETISHLQQAIPSLENIDPEYDEVEDLSRVIDSLHKKLINLEKLTSKIWKNKDKNQLEEDVEMTSDDIINKPNVVKKLAQDGIDIEVNDDLKNKSTNGSNSSTYISNTTY